MLILRTCRSDRAREFGAGAKLVLSMMGKIIDVIWHSNLREHGLSMGFWLAGGCWSDYLAQFRGRVLLLKSFEKGLLCLF